MLAAVTMVTTTGHRPVSPTRGEPARMPRGRPAVEQVSANKQSGRAEEQERKKQQHSQSLLIPPSFLKHPHGTAKMQPSLSSLFLSVFFPLSLCILFLAPSSSNLELQRLACSSQRVLLQNELMFTINKSAEGKPQSSYSQDPVEQICHPTQHSASFTSHYS